MSKETINFSITLIVCVWFASFVFGAGNNSIIFDYQYFPNEGIYREQEDSFIATLIELNYSHTWNNNRESFSFIPFLRVNQHNTNRSHIDIRELVWIKSFRDWEFTIGVNQVFWGVAESQHLVDVINQYDYLEDMSGLTKLGQPLINIAWVKIWGVLDFYLLPYFRERAFPENQARLRMPFSIEDKSRYSNSEKEWHKDFAIRWSHHFENWDLGISYFSGINRDPEFILEEKSTGNYVLVPYYSLMSQTGLSLQYTVESWLWKLEAISRHARAEDYFAYTGGFEYTFYSVFGTRADIGLMMEYLYDDRGDEAQTPFEDDYYIGCRLVFNDIDNTSITVGMISDSETPAKMITMDATKLIGNDWDISFLGTIFMDQPETDIFYGFRKDDYIELRIGWYF
jgi:hypothetical protein